MSEPNQINEPPNHEFRPRRPRWWPAGLILALASAAICYVRFVREGSHQERNLRTMSIVLITAALLLLWVLFLSRLRWRVRLLVFACVAVGIGLIAAIFEIRGVTGDLLPIFKPRWQRGPPPITAGNVVSPNPAPTGTPTPINSFSQFMGPHRNATLPEGTKLARDWTARPPEKLWRQAIGAAWSGFAVVGDRAVTQEQRGNDELVVCYELLTGKVLWSHADAARYFTTIAGEGPRATPSIVAERVVTLGATGILNCFDLGTGRVIWSKDIIADNQTHAGSWGVAGSPLVHGEFVIVNPGGKNGRSLVAYRLNNGEFAWGGGDDDASYSSPYAATLGGAVQILIFNQHAIFGHDAVTGTVLWRYPWDSHQPHVALPVVVGEDRVLVSSGYGVGSELLQVTRDDTGKFKVTQLWKTIRLKSKFNNLVTRDNFVYGLDDGILSCLDLATGELKWKDGRYGHGQFLLVRDLLLITAENGEVVLVEPVPTERRELTKFSALKGKTWNPPALVGDLLLVRNDQEAACYRLPTSL